jgi:hypothetical protein
MTAVNNSTGYSVSEPELNKETFSLNIDNDPQLIKRETFEEALENFFE